MRILMLGNSFTYFNDMPDMLAELLHAEVRHNTCGGATLAAQLDAAQPLGQTAQALLSERWDYVVLQEYSTGPIEDRAGFLRSMSALCRQARSAGAEPVLYATWAFKRDGCKLAEYGMDYDEMLHRLQAAYREAAEQNHALLAEVGAAFYAEADTVNLYKSDDYHPSSTGSKLAAQVIARTILSTQEDTHR